MCLHWIILQSTFENICNKKIAWNLEVGGAMNLQSLENIYFCKELLNDYNEVYLFWVTIWLRQRSGFL